ncbi:hypothetical protein V2G26_000946 [Clonostachys chloroleuca]
MPYFNSISTNQRQSYKLFVSPSAWPSSRTPRQVEPSVRRFRQGFRMGVDKGASSYRDCLRQPACSLGVINSSAMRPSVLSKPKLP